jgi:hypothetical protein
LCVHLACGYLLLVASYDISLATLTVYTC